MIDNINPKIWGDALWKAGYLISYAYPANPSMSDRQLMRDYFLNYQQILPCEKCRINFQQHLLKYPLNDNALKNKFNLMSWLLNINNEVNKILGKPSITLNDVYEKYLIAAPQFNAKQILTFILIIAIVCILGAYIVIKKFKC